MGLPGVLAVMAAISLSLPVRFETGGAGLCGGAVGTWRISLRDSAYWAAPVAIDPAAGIPDGGLVIRTWPKRFVTCTLFDSPVPAGLSRLSVPAAGRSAALEAAMALCADGVAGRTGADGGSASKQLVIPVRAAKMSAADAERWMKNYELAKELDAKQQ